MGNINPRKVDVSNKFVSNYKNSCDCQYFGQKNGFVKNIDLRKINAPDKSVSDESYNALKKEIKDLKETIFRLIENQKAEEVSQKEAESTDETLYIDILLIFSMALCNISLLFPLFFLLLILFNVGKNTLIEPLLLFKYKFSQMIKCIYHKCKKARFRIKIRSRSYKALRKRFKCI